MAKKRQRGNGQGTLFRRNGRGTWIARWHNHDGKRQERSTRTTDKTAAERILKKRVADVALRLDGVIDARQDRYAIEGRKPLFRCREVRRQCVLYGDEPPVWATTGVCAIHKAFIDAEKAMRASLSEISLADLMAETDKKIPASAFRAGQAWFAARQQARGIVSDDVGESGSSVPTGGRGG